MFSPPLPVFQITTPVSLLHQFCWWSHHFITPSPNLFHHSLMHVLQIVDGVIFLKCKFYYVTSKNKILHWWSISLRILLFGRTTRFHTCPSASSLATPQHVSNLMLQFNRTVYNYLKAPYAFLSLGLSRRPLSTWITFCLSSCGQCLPIFPALIEMPLP